MIKKGHQSSSKRLNEAFQFIKNFQAELEGKGEAICLAAKFDGAYQNLIGCHVKVDAKRHTISRAKYLRQISDKDNVVLCPLPIDATHLAHQTKKDGCMARQKVEEITHVEPKRISM